MTKRLKSCRCKILCFDLYKHEDVKKGDERNHKNSYFKRMILIFPKNALRLSKIKQDPGSCGRDGEYKNKREYVIYHSNS